MKSFPALATLVLLLGAAGLARAEEGSLLKDSPFAAPGAGGPGASGSALDQLEFSGVSVIGKQIFVSVIDKKTGKGGWLPLKTQGHDGLVVEAYDAKTDEVTVRLGAQTKILSLRLATVKMGTALPPPPTAMPAPLAPAMPPPAAPAVAETPSGKSPEIEAQEREARMMVSDLLEIGMIQRKAYEEKKAAEDAARKQRGG